MYGWNMDQIHRKNLSVMSKSLLNRFPFWFFGVAVHYESTHSLHPVHLHFICCMQYRCYSKRCVKRRFRTCSTSKINIRPRRNTKNKSQESAEDTNPHPVLFHLATLPYYARDSTVESCLPLLRNILERSLPSTHTHSNSRIDL